MACGSSPCPGLSHLCSAPTLWFLLHPVHTGQGGVEGPFQPRPPQRPAGKGCPGFGTFSSSLLGNSPTHPHEHQKDINWFMELLVCRSRLCRAGRRLARLSLGLPAASSP